jgi:hypothetical protein
VEKAANVAGCIIISYFVLTTVWTAAFVIRQELQPEPKSRLDRDLKNLDLRIHAVIALAPLYWIFKRSFKKWKKEIKELKQKREHLIELAEAFEPL